MKLSRKIKIERMKNKDNSRRMIIKKEDHCDILLQKEQHGISITKTNWKHKLILKDICALVRIGIPREALKQEYPKELVDMCYVNGLELEVLEDKINDLKPYFAIIFVENEDIQTIINDLITLQKKGDEN